MSTEKVVCLLCMQFVISHHNQDCPKPGFKARYRKYRENLHQYANRDHRRDRPAAWTHYRSMLVSYKTLRRAALHESFRNIHYKTT